jgi:phosphate:Na+ symporter
MLGADVGTSLVTIVLSFDLSWLAPLDLPRRRAVPRPPAETIGRFGRILIGLGLIIFALQWIGVAARGRPGRRGQGHLRVADG